MFKKGACLVSTNTTRHSKVAFILSLLLAGLGQLYNRQLLKGFSFIILEVAYLIAFYDLFNMGFWGLFTLGEVVRRDHSIRLLIQGILAVIVLAFGIGFYIFNVVDAYRNGKKREEGIPLPTIKEQFKHLYDYGFPYLMISPGLFLLIFTVVFPLIFMVLLAFTNYDLYHSPPAKLVDWVGFENFKKVFTLDIWRDTMMKVLAWTIIWTFVATTGQIIIGIFLAVIVNQKDLKGKAIIRTILILPWAVPAFVTILIFANMFNETFGVINTSILPFFGLDAIPWMTDVNWTRTAVILIQFWLGFPFVMAMTTGVLQAIPDDLYEAATMDGATPWQKFRNITLPMILYATAPILITQYTFNFNNFNIIYLFNSGGPAIVGQQQAGGTDILISWIYKLTLNSAQYSIAAAITLILGIIIVTFAVIQFKRTRSFKEEDLM
ncbi:carbohydrate ABC transporter permease [Aeribacillus pallidus]|uniref:carbohydrate ABC transporter permease n=1 Tax=Aeribacillus pallidus TaxID=33936 RepID=UPI003D1C4F5A